MAGGFAGSPGWSHEAAGGLRFSPEPGKGRERQPARGAARLTRSTVDPLGAAIDQDAEAVRRVLAGDVEAFTGIVERWQGPLFRLALRYTNERGAAEDLCQEVFLRAFRGLGKWRSEARFSTWLIALATNVYRSHARRAPAPEPLGERDPAAPAPASADPALGERLRRAVNALPARYRDALHLYYFHAADVGAAAATLGLPEGTLKARLARGRKLLEGMLTARA
jgi:RNA polymerase sigma-70 factor (ECF subfamily)